jgi:hypothetical protein
MLDALLVPDTHAFAFDDDLRICASEELLVLDQVMPHICAISFDYAAYVILVKCAVHCRCSSLFRIA